MKSLSLHQQKFGMFVKSPGRFNRQETGQEWKGGDWITFFAQIDGILLMTQGWELPVPVSLHSITFSFSLFTPFLFLCRLLSIFNVSNNHGGMVAQAVLKRMKWAIIEEFITKTSWFPDYRSKVKYLSSPKSSSTTVFQVTHFSLFFHSNPDELVSKIKGMSFTSCLHCKGL